MPRRSTHARTRRSTLDDWQAEWKATHAELVAVLTSIEACLKGLEASDAPEPRLRVYAPDEALACGT